MKKLAKQLIKLGHQKPEIRGHLRPVLDKISGSAKVSPLETDYLGRPIYFAKDVNDPKSGIQKAQKAAFNRKYRLALKHSQNGKLKTLVEKVLRTKLPQGDFEVDRISTDGMVEDDVDSQNWARLMLTLKGAGSIDPGYNEMVALHKLVKKAYSIPGECAAQVNDLSVYKDELVLEITWWGAMWDDSFTKPYHDAIREEEERARREEELARKMREEAARMKDPEYVKGLIKADLLAALRRLDTYGARHVSIEKEGPKSLSGSYRSDLPESYNSDDWDRYDDEDDDEGDWYDEELPSEGEYDDQLSRELSRAEGVLEDYLREHKKYIKSIDAYQGDKNYIEVVVTLK